jgi:hypothetical protein
VLASLKRSRTEISTLAYLTTWSPRLACPSYVTSRRVGLVHFIVRLIVNPDCGEASDGSCQNDKIGCGGCETLVRFRSTFVTYPPVPNPLFSNVWALASHNPSGDRVSVDQMVVGPQPGTNAKTTTIRGKIALETAETQHSSVTTEP